MKTQDSAGPARDAQSQQAWDALGTVQDNPRIQQWLQEIPALTAATAARRSSAKRWALAAGVAAVAVGLAVTVYLQVTPQRYATTIGEQRDLVMEDGSRITLNTNTSLAVKYSKDRRYIEMSRGEALFSVKHDATRPFDVVAGGTLTRALGTEFNVDLRDEQVTVSVLDGAVRVIGPDSALQLPATALGKGQALEFHPGQRRVQENKADLKRIEAWRTRRLEFSDTPLATAVEEFNRYSTLRVVVGTPELSAIRVSGVFRIGDEESFLYTLREALGVETHEAAGEVVLMQPRQ